MTSEICYTLSTEVGHHFYPSFIVPTSVTVHHLYYFIHGCLGIMSVRHRFYQTFYIHWMLEYIISSFLCKKSIGFIPDWPNSRQWSIYIIFATVVWQYIHMGERGWTNSCLLWCGGDNIPPVTSKSFCIITISHCWIYCFGISLYVCRSPLLVFIAFGGKSGLYIALLIDYHWTNWYVCHSKRFIYLFVCR